MSRVHRLLSAALAAAMLLVAVPAAATTSAPPPHAPPPEAICPEGQFSCVERTVRDMTDRYETLADACDYDAIFSLMYLRTTERYQEVVESEPDFFEDTAWLNHYDTVFAEYYARAFENDRKGFDHLVPPAWQIAFEAAENHEVSSVGDMMLGMNAHINRDLAFTLADILEESTYEARYDDHTKVNDFLSTVNTEAIFAEVYDRFDPTVYQQLSAGGFGDVAAWRQTAWENAVRLVTAETDQERADAAAYIEGYSAGIARWIVANFPPPRDNYGDFRTSYCESQQHE